MWKLIIILSLSILLLSCAQREESKLPIIEWNDNQNTGLGWVGNSTTIIFFEKGVSVATVSCRDGVRPIVEKK